MLPRMGARPPLSEPPAPRPVILIVGGGPFQVDIARTARSLGAVVAVADRDPAAAAFGHADHPLAIDIVDHPALIDAARRLGVSGVVSAASDVAVPAVAAVGEALGLRVSSKEAVTRCRDKLEMYAAVQRAGLAMPRTVWVEDDAQARAAAREVGGFPLVVKPRSAAGGRGVSVVRDRHGLRRAMERARAYDPRGCLVQTFVGGHAIGVEAFFWDGVLALAVVMDDQFEDGFVSPVGHALPSELPEAVQAQVRDDVVAYARALGVTEGPANFDLRVERGRTVLLEVNARLGGNSITDLVRSAYGVDLSAATVRAAIGQDPRPELALGPVHPTASRLLVVKAEGVAHLDDPFGRIADREGIVAVELAVRDGEPMALRVDEHAIVGRCVVRGPTAAAAVEKASEVRAAVTDALRVIPR